MKRSKSKGIRVEDVDKGDDEDRKYIWNETSGQVMPVDEGNWNAASVVSSPAGEKNGKIRYYLILALTGSGLMKEADIRFFATQIKKAEKRFGVEIEGADGGRGYTMFTLLIGPDVVPADFVEMCIRESNKKSVLFKKDYFITNIARPTGNEVISFLESLN